MSSILSHAPFAYIVKDTEHLTGDVTFQATDDFRFGFAFFHTPLQIYPAPIVIAKPDNHYSMNSGICLAVTTAVETVTVGFT